MVDYTEKVKKRKIGKKDWQKIERFVKEELKTRQDSTYRKKHEKMWKEVDRQVAMESTPRIKRDREAASDYRSCLEVGELAKASEVFSADVRRMSFPDKRKWFEVHSEAETGVDEEGNQQPVDPKILKAMNGGVRALMTQQHIDFGFLARVDLSIKEAFHHGSYVAEVIEESALLVHNGSGVQSYSAPVWKAHSMWNCWPDPSPSVVGTNLFYPGSMIIREYMPLHKLKKLSGEGYMPAQYKKIEKRTNRAGDDDTEDVEIIKYFGDVVIERTNGDIYLPNQMVHLANGTIYYMKESELPFPRIIYNGYEKMDVRDPYYVSPIIKMSPMQKMYSRLANRLMDGIDLRTEPPTEYDGNDPDYILNGGPDLSPGAKNPRKGKSSFQPILLGDPQAALQGMQWVDQQVKSGLGIGGPRTGVSEGTEQTATEVATIRQGGEIRIVDFVGKHELHGLRPFLYMQHYLNLKSLKDYPYYSPEMDTPEFARISKEQLPKMAHFEIVGSKGVIDEQERMAKTASVASFWMNANPDMINMQELMEEMFRDAGWRNPEKFIKKTPGGLPPEIQEQIQQIIEQSQQQIQALQEELQKFNLQDEEHSLEIQAKNLQIEQQQGNVMTLRNLLRLTQAKAQVEKANVNRTNIQ